MLNNLEPNQKPYSIDTLLKNGERDLKDQNIAMRLGYGSRRWLDDTILNQTQLHGNINHLIWETNTNVFGDVVSYVFIFIYLYHSSLQYFFIIIIVSQSISSEETNFICWNVSSRDEEYL